jgi:hypothetical protein
MVGGWQSHGAPFDSQSAVGASYLIQKQNRSPPRSLGPNALSNSTIGIPASFDHPAVSRRFANVTGFERP